MADFEKTAISTAHGGDAVIEKEATFNSPLDSQEDIGSRFGINEKGLIRKLDRKLLPALTLLYLLSFLDRSNGNALDL